MATATASTPWALADQLSSQVSSNPHAHREVAPHDSALLIPQDFVLPSQKRPHSDLSTLPVAPLPTIDLALADRSLLLRQIHEACSRWGVFLVTNHGVPDALLQHLQAQIEAFLALPVADRAPRFLGNRGEGYGTGAIRKSTGIMEWRDSIRLHTYPLSRRNYEVWPTNPAPFRKALEDFADQIRKLQVRMLGLMSESLGLGPTRLEEVMGEIQQTILMNHYPPCPQPELAVGIDAHTDVGAVTGLWQFDGVVGLCVLRDETWYSVNPPRPGSLFIIVAAQVEKASNGIYKSPIHRGVLSRTQHRVSISSFYQLKMDQEVAPAAELVDDEHPPLYKPLKFKDYVADK